ncbi:MAG: rhomboid family intramembrane serine protease [Microthrixaceae bacterium]
MGPPFLTMALVGINVAVFVIDAVSGERLTGVFGGFAARFGLARAAVAQGEWWRLVTGGFLHAGLLHLGFNMWALWVIGAVMEPVVGRAKLAAIYAVSLLGGGLGVMLLADPDSLTVGASGAIFGLFGAFAVLEMSRGGNPLQSGIGLTIGLNLFLTFTIPGISVGGHLGGLVAGAVVGALFFGLRPHHHAIRAMSDRVSIAIAGAFGLALFGAAVGVARFLG